MKISDKMLLKEMLSDCMQRCEYLQYEAEKVISAAEDRKYSKEPYILDPELFIEKKITTLEESAAFERAAMCLERCELPIDVVKRIMSSNIKEVQMNL